MKIEEKEKTLLEGSVFEAATQNVLDLVAERNRKKLPFCFNPYLSLVKEGAQAGFMLNAYLNKGRIGKGSLRYKSFFANSFLEAIHGAVKMIRHKMIKSKPLARGSVLIYDPSQSLAPLFDPLAEGPQQALVPQVHFAHTMGEVEEALKNRHTGLIFRMDASVQSSETAALYASCKQQNMVFVLDSSSLAWETADHFFQSISFQPDIFIWGESMTGHQVPFGAFSMTDEVFSPWASVNGSLIHSSTFGGNGLALNALLNHALDHCGWAERFPNLRERVEDLAKDAKSLRNAYIRYVNPLVLDVFSASYLDSIVEKAEGSRIRLNTYKGTFKEVIDCLGAAGSALRGHNPPDIVEEVLERHDAKHDYWAELRGQLTEMTGLKEAFPAVSGASAVEIGITMARLAKPKRRKIIIFKGNFSGRTLISLAGSTGTSNAPFEPLYMDIVLISPNSKDAPAKLEAELRSNEVCLVWFELLQGQNSRLIPQKLIDLVNELKEEYGYFIGVDEILTGMFRTGDFLMHETSIPKVDVVSMSKGLSDMTFPVAACLLSDDVLSPARSGHPALVSLLSQLYKNQLGAHVASHALQKAVEENLAERVRRNGKLLKEGLEKVQATSALVNQVRGKGLILYLKPDFDKFPFSYLGPHWSESLLTRWALQEGNTLVYYSRYSPPLSISEEEVNEVVSGLGKSIRKNALGIFFSGYGHALKVMFKMPGIKRKAKGPEREL